MTFGGTPSSSARTVTGVPCMSLPPTMRTSSPFIRWYRAKISAGMNVETAWPRCRGPDAYGQATQTRIFAIRGGSMKGGPFKPFAGRVSRRWSADGIGPDYHCLPVLPNRGWHESAMCRRLKGVVLMALQRGMRQDMNAPPEIDKRMSNLGTMPRILCWKCRKLTPFELDRCEHCGSAFAGGTGGVYANERKPRPRP